MLESKWGKLVSYGERLTRTFNYPQMLVFHINQNGPPLEVVFNKLTNEVVSANFIHQDLYNGVGTGMPSNGTDKGKQLR
jgi:hypothetical protein